jgi:prevent-host-death family protein
MLSVGIRELKMRASDLVRLVRENGEDIRVTYHGRAVAQLTPLTPALSPGQNAQAVWTDIDQLAIEIGACWPTQASAADTVAEGRREL